MSEIVNRQRSFYEGLYSRHGEDPRSLSHRDRPTQEERFARLARGFPDPGVPFTVHEIGCGLGHLGEYLNEHHPDATYSGSDVVQGFVEACRSHFPASSFFLRDVTAGPPDERYDWVVLSGTFNLPLGIEVEEWDVFIRRLMGSMFAMSTRGMAVNFLTTYSDPGRRQDDLHYQDEKAILDFVVGALSRHVELDMAGPLYEFTLRVWRPEEVGSRYPGPAFDRYLRRE